MRATGESVEPTRKEPFFIDEFVTDMGHHGGPLGEKDVEDLKPDFWKGEPVTQEEILQSFGGLLYFAQKMDPCLYAAPIEVAQRIFKDQKGLTQPANSEFLCDDPRIETPEKRGIIPGDWEKYELNRFVDVAIAGSLDENRELAKFTRRPFLRRKTLSRYFKQQHEFMRQVFDRTMFVNHYLDSEEGKNKDYSLSLFIDGSVLKAGEELFGNRTKKDITWADSKIRRKRSQDSLEHPILKALDAPLSDGMCTTTMGGFPAANDLGMRPPVYEELRVFVFCNEKTIQTLITNQNFQESVRKAHQEGIENSFIGKYFFIAAESMRQAMKLSILEPGLFPEYVKKVIAQNEVSKAETQALDLWVEFTTEYGGKKIYSPRLDLAPSQFQMQTYASLLQSGVELDNKWLFVAGGWTDRRVSAFPLLFYKDEILAKRDLEGESQSQGPHFTGLFGKPDNRNQEKFDTMVIRKYFSTETTENSDKESDPVEKNKANWFALQDHFCAEAERIHSGKNRNHQVVTTVMDWDMVVFLNSFFRKVGSVVPFVDLEKRLRIVIPAQQSRFTSARELLIAAKNAVKMTYTPKSPDRNITQTLFLDYLWNMYLSTDKDSNVLWRELGRRWNKIPTEKVEVSCRPEPG